MTSNKVQALARDKLGQLQSEISARETEIRRLTGDISRREAELAKMHVVNHVDVHEMRSQ
jgi:septal ring factor EnvC (AmiA/AmiB activator)